MFCKERCSWNFCKVYRKTPVPESLFSNAGLMPGTLLKKWLCRRCFPVNFGKFLRAPFLQNNSGWLLLNIKDTHREKAPSNKTPALTESMNMDNWVVGTSNQLFKTGLINEKKFSEKLSSYWQNSVLWTFQNGPFCAHHSICLNISFWHDRFVWK